MRKIILCALVLLAFVPALVMAQSVGYSLQNSPTSEITESLFSEASDQYLNVLLYGQLKDPIFLFKLAPYSYHTGTTGTTVSDTSPATPTEVGMGGRFGAFYVGAYYAFNANTEGNLGSSQSTSKSSNDVPTFGPDNVLNGKVNTTTEQVDYTPYSYNNPVGLFGFSIGNMQIGVKESLKLINAPEIGTFDAAATVSATTAAISGPDGTAANSVQTTYVIDPTANTYVATNINSTLYATATENNLSIDNDLEAGVTMPLGALTLRGKLNIGIAATNYNCALADNTNYVQTSVAYPSFDPTGYNLPGKANTAINNLTYWKTDYFKYFSSNFSVQPELMASVEYPFTLFSNPATAIGGLEYLGAFTGHSSDVLGSAATTGSSANVTGSGIAVHSYSHSVALASGLFQTTNVEGWAYTAYKYANDSSHAVNLPLSLTVQPNSAFRFGLGLTPGFKMYGTKYTSSGEYRRLTTYSDGDTVDAATDPDDYSQVDYAKSATSTTSNSTTSLSIGFRTGTQIYLKPNTIRLNLGAGITTYPLVRTTTNTLYSDMQESYTDVTRMGQTTRTANASSPMANVENTITNADTQTEAGIDYDVGLTYFLTPNVTFDFMVANSRALNLAATTDLGGFLNLANYNIQMTIKLPPSGSKGE